MLFAFPAWVAADGPCHHGRRRGVHVRARLGALGRPFRHLGLRRRAGRAGRRLAGALDLRAPLASRLSFLGDASYSIYLSHTFVVPAGVQALKRLGVQDSLAIVLAVSLAVVVAGCLSYVWLERPMTTFFKRSCSVRPSSPAL
jgi:hypothetical protein